MATCIPSLVTPTAMGGPGRDSEVERPVLEGYGRVIFFKKWFAKKCIFFKVPDAKNFFYKT